MGVVKSLKGHCAFLQLNNFQQLAIGRLHRLEAQNGPEFDGLTVGETIKAKVLKVTQGRLSLVDSHLDKDKTWIELTRRREHLNKPGDLLDEGLMKKTLFSLEDLKTNTPYEAVITDINYLYSQPIRVALSPFVKGSVSFNHIVDSATLIQEGGSCLQRFKVGASVKVYYTKDGEFSLAKDTAERSGKLAKGDLFVVRLVKGVHGKGVTVQLDAKTFGFIEICEITDDLVGNVIETLEQLSPIFAARVIAFDKHQKPLLSARDSVV